MTAAVFPTSGGQPEGRLKWKFFSRFRMDGAGKQEVAEMVFDLQQSIREKRVLLAAHRGVNGGNIPCNSLACYRVALNQGADIIEMDVQNSLDGELFMLHPHMEPVHIGLPKGEWIENMPAEKVRLLHLANQDVNPTQYPIATFHEALDMLKGKCYLNVDKFWQNPKSIAGAIRSRDMQDQVIVKSTYNPEVLDIVEAYAADMQFLLVTRDAADLERIRKRKLRYVGVEMLWTDDADPLCRPEVMESLHRDGKVIWANSIVYYYKDILSAGHTDDIALLEDPERGWGWLCSHGFDIIQTDWLLACDMYLKSRGYRG